MTPDIRKSIYQRPAPAPTRPARGMRPAGFLLFIAALCACGIGAMVGYAWSDGVSTTPQGRTLAYQATLFVQGYDPRLAFQDNAPFGTILHAQPSPLLARAVHALYELAAGRAFALMAALGGGLSALGLFAVARAYAGPKGPLGMPILVALGGTGLLALMHLQAAALPPDWGMHAGAFGVAMLGGAMGLARRAALRTGAGICGGLALAAAPSLLPLVVLGAVAGGCARRPATRQYSALGCGLGGLLALGGGHTHGALALWGIGAAVLVSGMARRRARGVIFAALAGGGAIAALAWAPGTGPEGAGLAHAPSVLALATAGMALARWGHQRAYAWRGMAIDGPLLMAVGVLPCTALALWQGWGAETALLGLATAGANAWGWLAGGGALAGGTALLAMAGPLPLRHIPACPAADVAHIVQDLREMQARRVLAEPVLGWQLLMAGSGAAVVSAGLEEPTQPQTGTPTDTPPSQEGPRSPQADARTALDSTDPQGQDARRITNRRSVEAIVVCNEAGTGDALKDRLWNAGTQDIAALGGWLTPAQERAGYAIYKVVRTTR